MVLIGMPDSPYVRRVAVSLKLMGLPFEHRHISVFRHMDRFRQVNPVIKAPSFIAGDGTVLMDSTLILDHCESLAPIGMRLMPAGPKERLAALRLIGLALAACEKCVAIVYENDQRPVDRRHAPWVERVSAQANAAFEELELAASGLPAWFGLNRPNAADVAVACAWRFGQYRVPDAVSAAKYPALAAYSLRAEALPEFAGTPLD
jgi:glutathione S-transferase